MDNLSELSTRRAQELVVRRRVDDRGIDLEEYVTTEAPGLNAFALEDGVVYQTYSSLPFGSMLFYLQLLDRTPKGDKAGVLVRRHDEYRELATAGRGSD